jgi:hypothetical protein
MTALVSESLKSGEYGVLFIIGHAIKNAHVRLDRLVGLGPAAVENCNCPCDLCGPGSLLVRFRMRSRA